MSNFSSACAGSCRFEPHSPTWTAKHNDTNYLRMAKCPTWNSTMQRPASRTGAGHTTQLGDQEGPEIFTVDLSVFVLTPGLSRTARQSWVLAFHNAFHSAFHHSSSQQHSPVPRSFASVPKDWKYVNGFHCALQRAQVP